MSPSPVTRVIKRTWKNKINKKSLKIKAGMKQITIIYFTVYIYSIWRMSDDMSRAAFLQLQGGFLCLVHTMIPFGILRSQFPFWTTQHSSSAFDLPLQCALCRDRRGIYKEQASGSGSAEGQRSLIRFPWTVRHFHPVAFSLSFFLRASQGWERCTINVPAGMSVRI